MLSEHVMHMYYFIYINSSACMYHKAIARYGADSTIVYRVVQRRIGSQELSVVVFVLCFSGLRSDGWMVGWLDGWLPIKCWSEHKSIWLNSCVVCVLYFEGDTSASTTTGFVHMCFMHTWAFSHGIVLLLIFHSCYCTNTNMCTLYRHSAGERTHSFDHFNIN